MLTAEIIQANCSKPLHRMSIAELKDMRVSKRSWWYSVRWDLDNLTHGSRGYESIRWDIALSDGGTLLDSKYELMLDWLRRFTWIAFSISGGNGTALKAGSAPSFSQGLSIVVPWLVEHSVHWPHELTKNVLDAFLEDLPGLLASRVKSGSEDEGKIKSTLPFTAINLIFRLWRLRRILDEAGIRPIPEYPWREFKGASAIAAQVAVEERGWIQPLPDEVAIPLLNKVQWFLGEPADDLLRLRDEMDVAYHRPAGNHHTGPGASAHAREKRQRKVCKQWKFCIPQGDTSPWHPPLPGKGSLRVLQLTKHIQAAALLALQAFSGMRVSELCGLPAGIDNATGLPICVERRLSPTGLNELFVLKTELSKTEETPRDAEWYIGLRPVGAQDLPITVRALIVLNRLMEPYRQILQTDRLLVSIRATQGLPKSRSGVNVMTRDAVLRIYKEFLAEWVDLSELPDESAHRTRENDLVEWRESKGRIITTHQLRKTFALYLLSVEPRLLPAVKRQFQHLSMAMTESGYWGRNIAQIESVDSVSAQQTALMMYELATGRTKLAGRAGERLSVNIAELSSALSGMGIEQGWRESVKWVKAKNVRSTIDQHGACTPLATSEMECWKRADSRPLGHRNPNYLTREPGLCAGCVAFWMDARHIPFWESRYIENEIAYRQAEQRGEARSFRRVKARAQSARALLHSVKFDLTGTEAKIAAGLNSSC